MKYRLLMCLLYLLILCTTSAAAQSFKYAPVVFAKETGGVFSFVKKWDYRWDVSKDDKGKFIKEEKGKITAEDTTHLFFTADCETNVQGGYQIRYCYAVKKGNSLTLNFSDGAPAYANEFNVHMLKGKFYIEPVIIYPAFTRGEKITHKVIGSKLVLYQPTYNAGKLISGFVDVEFIETSTGTNQGIVQHKYYFRGYFKTVVKA